MRPGMGDFEADARTHTYDRQKHVQRQQHEEYLLNRQLEAQRYISYDYQHQMQAAGTSGPRAPQMGLVSTDHAPLVVPTRARLSRQLHDSRHSPRAQQGMTSPQSELQQSPQPKLELPLHEQLEHPLHGLYKEQHILDAQEDALVVEALAVGMAWSDIAAALPTRSLSDLRQRNCMRIHSQRDRQAARREQVRARVSVAEARRARAEQESRAAEAEAAEAEQADIEALPPSPPTDAAESRGKGWRGGPKLVGDERVTLRHAVPHPSTSLEVAAFHKLSDLSGVQFFQKAEVVDPDQESGGEMFSFDLDDPVHGACFNMGDDGKGGTLISWSRLHALYILKDGTRWAEHSDFVDRSDLEELGRSKGQEVAHILPDTDSPRELFAKTGRQHTRLSATEYQCWVYDDKLPERLPEGVDPSDAFFTRTAFDPKTLQPV